MMLDRLNSTHQNTYIKNKIRDPCPMEILTFA